MHETNSFRLALIISASLHILVVLPLAVLDILPKQKVLTGIEVNYLRIKQDSSTTLKSSPLKDKAKSRLDLERVGLNQRIVLSNDENIPLKNVEKQASSFDELLMRAKSLFQKPKVSEARLLSKSSIKLSLADDSEKVARNPAYLNYQNFIRENFRRFLYNKYSDISESGMVYLTFVLNRDGSLKDAQVVDSKSNSSKRLKEIVLDGLRGAAPFPPLPKELNSPVVTFSVTVHFVEVED